MKSEYPYYIGARLPTDQGAYLEKLAKEKGTTRSDVLRLIISITMMQSGGEFA